MSRVRVVCRFRPPNAVEEENGVDQCVKFDSAEQVTHYSATESKHTFTFDNVLDTSTNQGQVFEAAGRTIVEDLLKGYNGTIFAYGQTGSGKTHTMMGPDIESESRGLIPRIVQAIFEFFGTADETMEFTVKVSMMEIYLERIRDLFDASKVNLKIKEDRHHGVYVQDVTEVYVASVAEVLELMRVGSEARAMASTRMNDTSSRSHSIFTMTVSQKNLKDESVLTGKLYLVDLAGSEKVGKTGAAGARLDEAKNINKSLSALGNVINALTDGKSTHVPYRDSKLTRILTESLGGNARTSLVICCSPCEYNQAETLSTLRFGNRAKSIKNKAHVNVVRSVEELERLLAAAEKKIDEQKGIIRALEAEIKIFREHATEETLDLVKQAAGLAQLSAAGDGDGEDGNAGSGDGGASGDLGAVTYATLAAKLREAEEEKLELLQVQDALLEQIQEKDMESQENAEKEESARKGLLESKTANSALSKENEILVQKLADMTFQTEKTQFELQEKSLTVDSLTEANSQLRSELEGLQGQVAKLQNQLADKDSDDEDTVAKKKLQRLTKEGSASGAEAELQQSLATNMGQGGDGKEVPEGAEALAQRVTELEAQLKSLSARNAELEGTAGTMSKEDKLRSEVGAVRSSYDTQLENMRTEMQRIESTDIPTGAEGENPSESAERAKQLEQDLTKLKEQAAHQLSQFDLLKEALLRDLQNRCEKVIDLEMSLDEAREQYNNLVKQTSNKALKRKVGFLEHNLEQLTNVHLQLVNQNSALKHENALAEKKLAFRNERIRHLELLLQDAQERIQQLQAIHEGDVTRFRELEEQTRQLSQGAVASQQQQQSIGGPRRVVRPIIGGGAGAQGGGGPSVLKRIRNIQGGGQQGGQGQPGAGMEDGENGYINVVQQQQQAAYQARYGSPAGSAGPPNTPHSTGSNASVSSTGSGKMGKDGKPRQSFWDLFKFKNKGQNNGGGGNTPPRRATYSPAGYAATGGPGPGQGTPPQQPPVIHDDIHALPSIESSPASAGPGNAPLTAAPQPSATGPTGPISDGPVDSAALPPKPDLSARGVAPAAVVAGPPASQAPVSTSVPGGEGDAGAGAGDAGASTGEGSHE